MVDAKTAKAAYAADLRIRLVSVRCPACGAKAGLPCIGRDGKDVMGIHADRKDAAKAAGKVSS